MPSYAPVDLNAALPFGGSPAGLGRIGDAPYSSFMNDPDVFLRVVKLPDTSTLSFEALGIPFEAQSYSSGDKAKLVIWGTLGYLPYSVVDAEKRRALIAILESARGLPSVLFGIDREMRIVVRGTYDIKSPPSTDYLFVPLVRLIQEARPFIRLIGAYL